MPPTPMFWLGKNIKQPKLLMGFKIVGYYVRNQYEYTEVLQDTLAGKKTLVTSATCHGVEPHDVGEENDNEN
jgi:hypothetical protein